MVVYLFSNKSADLYSARLYKSKSKKMVIFSMCLLQPHYVKVSHILSLISLSLYSLSLSLSLFQTFDKAIAGKYSIPKEDKDPDVINGVTIVADEVRVRQNDTQQWKTFCRTSPASVIQLQLFTGLNSTIFTISLDFKEGHLFSQEMHT